MHPINRLPLYRTLPTHPVGDADSQRDFGTLLFVDDNAVILQTLLAYFSRNWNVLTAKNGMQALDYLRAFKPDAIVSDYRMPGLDGAELAQAVRRNKHMCGVPFFLATAMEFTKTELQQLGVTKVVPKPFDFSDLERDLQDELTASAPPLILPPILPDDPEGFGAIRRWIPRW